MNFFFFLKLLLISTLIQCTIIKNRLPQIVTDVVSFQEIEVQPHANTSTIKNQSSTLSKVLQNKIQNLKSSIDNRIVNNTIFVDNKLLKSKFKKSNFRSRITIPFKNLFIDSYSETVLGSFKFGKIKY